MRVSQMARQYAWQPQLQPGKTGAPPASPALVAAQRANQARLTDGAKGWLQAAGVRDGLVAVGGGVDRAVAALARADRAGATASERQAAQKEFAAALDAIDLGAKSQQDALADKALANSTSGGTRTRVALARDLGVGASPAFASLADLRTIDLGSASAEDRVEAGKVLAAAKAATATAKTLAEGALATSATRLDRIQGTLDALGGTDPAGRSGRARDRATLETLVGRAPPPWPGGLFSGLA
jgi:hypothetical protein